MTHQQWAKLGRGDVLLMLSGHRRRVLEGPDDHRQPITTNGGLRAIVVRKVSMHGYNNPLTTYFFNDLRNKIRRVTHDERVLESLKS